MVQDGSRVPGSWGLPEKAPPFLAAEIFDAPEAKVMIQGVEKKSILLILKTPQMVQIIWIPIERWFLRACLSLLYGDGMIPANTFKLFGWKNQNLPMVNPLQSASMYNSRIFPCKLTSGYTWLGKSMRLHFLLRTVWGTNLRKSVRVAYSWGAACCFFFSQWICMRFGRTLRRHIATIPLRFAFQSLI